MTEDKDDLLALINGDPAMPPLIDPAPDPAPTQEAELRVAAPPPMPPVVAADAKHALAAGGTGYRIKVRGFYFANNPEGKGKIKKPYELEINVAQLGGAKSTIKNKLLLPALKLKYPDAVRHRTFHIVGAQPLTPDTPAPDSLSYMGRGQLEAYVKAKKVPVDLSTYAPTDAGTTLLRAAVIDHRQNPQDFAAREALRMQERQADADLARLNPELHIGTEAD